jgi:hypothetical protein
LSYSREFVGKVVVKSGRLVISDPENVKDHGWEIAADAPMAAAKIEEGGEGDILASMAVAIPAPFRDGEHSVFITRNDKGDVASVEIQMDGA